MGAKFRQNNHLGSKNCLLIITSEADCHRRDEKFRFDSLL